MIPELIKFGFSQDLFRVREHVGFFFFNVVFQEFFDHFHATSELWACRICALQVRQYQGVDCAMLLFGFIVHFCLSFPACSFIGRVKDFLLKLGMNAYFQFKLFQKLRAFLDGPISRLA